MSFKSFFITTSSIIVGGIVCSEYFFYRLDPRMEKAKKDFNDILNNQKEDAFRKFDQYPQKVYQNTKDNLIDGLTQKIQNLKK